jgi:hypothetical protein
MKKYLVFAAIALCATLSLSQTQMLIPPQSGTYSGEVRGFWFQAPAAFIITGLQVPTDANSGSQSIALLRFTAIPPTYTSTTNDFQTLFLTQNNANSGILPVNIQINAGDYIGVLGCRGGITSYGQASYTSNINGLPVTLARLGMQYPLASTTPKELWTENNPIGRVLLFYGYIDTVNCPRIAVAPGSFRIGPNDALDKAFTICNTGIRDTLQYSIMSNARFSVDTASGRIKAGGCKNLKITFNRSGLLPGTYFVQLQIQHNAYLAANPLSVPCTLLVDSAQVPHIAAAPRSFRIGPSDGLVKTMTICNTGTRDSLQYTFSSNARCSVDTLSGKVAAGGCKTPILTFSRAGLLSGTHVFSLAIQHNAILEPNPLSVLCTLVVDSTTIACQVPSMAVTIFTGDTAVRNMMVQNTGSSMLNFSVGGSLLSGYITARADSSTLSGGQNSLVRFKYDARALITSGFYVDTFKIAHNAKNLSSPIKILCSLTVRSNIPSLIPVSPDPTINRKPLMKWHPVASATVYIVEIAQASSFTNLLIIQQTGDTVFTPLTNLPMGDIYWRVRCDLNPRPSLPDYFLIQNDSIPVLNPIVPDTIPGQIGTTFSWSRSVGATSYKILISRVDTASIVVQTFLTDNFYIHPVLLAKGKYVWTVSANFDFSKTAYPDTFWVGNPSGVIKGAKSELPKSFMLSVTGSGSGIRVVCALPLQPSSASVPVTVDLYDTRGKIVRSVHRGNLSAGWYQFEIGAGAMANGVYYCRMQWPGNRKIASVYFVK